MAEKRKPDTVLWVRHAARRSMKVELFKAAQFEGQLRHFTGPAGTPIPTATDTPYFRLRAQGVWFPAGRRVLYTPQQVLDLISKEIFRHETN